MKKRFLSILCVLAIVLGMVIPSAAFAVTDTTCDCNATDVEWTTLTAETVLESGKHYRLEGDVDLSAQYSISTDGFVACIDLAGHTLSNASGRVFLLGATDNSGSATVVVNVMDSSSGKTGRVEGQCKNSNASGGVCYLYAGATLNIYGGTFAPANLSTYVCKAGGIIQIRGGTVNMYGGKIIGAKATTGGAINVYADATLNVEGGSIESGEATTANCVCAADSSIVRLSGNASVEEIYCAGDPSGCLTISGAYTGTVTVNPKTALVEGAALAKSDSADISGATITVTGTTYTAVVSGSSIIVGKAGWCESCQKPVVWQSLTGALPANASGHYRLTKNVSASQVAITSEDKICLDLAGYSYTSTGRAFILGEKAGTYKVDLNIQDSSANKTGVMQGYGSSGFTGGVIYAYRAAKLSIYSGTIRLAENGVAKTGGAIAMYVGAEVNLYGGKIIGGPVSETGGAINVRESSTLNVAGGSIEGGTADIAGDCIYVTNGATVTLSGDGSVEQLYFPSGSDTELNISGKYTGTAQLKYATVPAAGADIGNCSNAEVLKENITIADTNMCAAVSGSNLVATELVGASVTDIDGKVAYYDTLAEAVAAYQSGNTIKLLADNSETVTIATATLDLYGCDLTGNVTVTGTLYVKDSATDDFTVEDVKGYGKITAVTSGVQAADGYLALSEDTGTSYHKYVLKLDKINLRPGKTALYYSGDIQVDEAVLGMIDHYGVAVSTESETPLADGTDAKSLYTAFGKADYGVNSTNSVLISNIMDGEDTDAVNAATMVYGRPYICFTNGDFFYGKISSANLQQVTEVIDAKVWSNLGLAQNRALMAMYDTHNVSMSAWNLANMKASVQKRAQAADDGVLKVLMIGNSHGLDSTNLLYEVFKAEGLPVQYNNLVLGAMYTGGCKVSEHAMNALSDLPYGYYTKNDGTSTDGSWTLYYDDQATLSYALADENWDVVLLQEMNTNSAREVYFQNENIEIVFNCVVKQLGYEPEFMWNMIWANPEIPQNYVDFLGLTPGDGSGGDVGAGNEGDDNEVSDALTEAKRRAWIFQTQNPPSYATSWPSNYVSLWDNSRQVMYNNIVSNVQNYVLAKDVHNINADEVMPNATAIQYAIEWLGMHEQDMYRDYTHVSDLGRLTVAYLWYAKLTGKTAIDAPKYTLVSQAVENTRQPLGYAKDYSQYSDMIQAAVNYALADPYGVIQNYTYAEYLALTPDKQAAYQASFDSFSVHSGWTYEMWLEQAVAGVTYTDYARMTADQQTAYADLRDDFDTWYTGIVENLGYAEYLALTADEQTAYAALQGDAFDTWLAKARAAFTYTDYVMSDYDDKLAYQATFAEGEFETLYADWLANMTYEEYMNLTMHQKLQYRLTYGTRTSETAIANFLAWYEAAKAAYEA